MAPGHDLRLIAPKFLKPHVESQKYDKADRQPPGHDRLDESGQEIQCVNRTKWHRYDIIHIMRHGSMRKVELSHTPFRLRRTSVIH